MAITLYIVDKSGVAYTRPQTPISVDITVSVSSKPDRLIIKPKEITAVYKNGEVVGVKGVLYVDCRTYRIKFLGEDRIEDNDVFIIIQNGFPKVVRGKTIMKVSYERLPLRLPRGMEIQHISVNGDSLVLIERGNYAHYISIGILDRIGTRTVYGTSV